MAKQQQWLREETPIRRHMLRRIGWRVFLFLLLLWLVLLPMALAFTSSRPVTTLLSSTLMQWSMTRCDSKQPRLPLSEDPCQDYDAKHATQTTHLVYSSVFGRHVVVENTTLSAPCVLESFLWFDEALDQYPQAVLAPLLEYVTTNSSSSEGGLMTTSHMLVAGMGGRPLDPDDTTVLYPVRQVWVDSVQNRAALSTVLQQTLAWFPTQVKNWFQQHESWFDPDTYSPAELRMRILFLLQPIPPLISDQPPTDLDWPRLCWEGYGAGMSVAQVSHALQTVPTIFLRRTTAAALPTTTLARLYQETPSVVLTMTHAQLDPLLTPKCTESAAWAYFHWRGWEWSTCRLLLEAWPTLHAPADRKAALYFQYALHVRPHQWAALTRTHGRLSTYSVPHLQQSCHNLQQSLELHSRQLQQLIFKQPSLLGISQQNLQAHVDFWSDLGFCVGSTCSPNLVSIVLAQPSLLQYSLAGNLQPKYSFFAHELGLSNETLVAWTVAYPGMWGRSLDGSLRPLFQGLCETCHLTRVEAAQVLQQAPELLRYSWTGNLRAKLAYIDSLCKADGSHGGVGRMVLRAPRILMQSIAALEGKAKLLGASAPVILQRNPSLLLNPTKVLQKRVDKVNQRADDMDLVEGLAGESKQPRGRPIWLLQGNTVEQVFGNAVEAAAHAGSSTSNMYRALRLGRPLKGKLYAYANATVAATGTPAIISARIATAATPGNGADLSVRGTEDVNLTSSGESVKRLTIRVAGRAYPPENAIRGSRRAGGMALQMPNMSLEDMRNVSATLWKGLRVRLLSDRQTIIIGYPYTRPSRPRCSLYACREALRVAAAWLETVPTKSARIDIVLDSNYAMDILRNQTLVWEWGSAESIESFAYQGPVDVYKANPDILYPVARLYYKLVEQDTFPVTKDVTVQFLHAVGDRHFKRLQDGAQMAAKLMYDTVR